MKRRTIDLAALAREHSTANSRMTAGMLAEGDATLWTADLRATTRGGKCWVTSAEDPKEESPE